MLLAIGELLADCISGEYVRDLSEARSFHVFQGGSPANVCANVQWLGGKAMIVSCVGNDGIGRMLVNEIRSTGLSTELIHVSDDYPTSIVLVGKSKDTPDFIPYRMADTRIPPVDTAWVDSADIIHSCAFALSKEPTRGTILNAFFYGHLQGKQISVDWNFAPSVWGHDNGREVFQMVCSYRPLLKFSMDDMERFTGIRDVDGAKKFLSDLPVRLVCLTMGKDGVWFRADGDWLFMPAMPVKEVVDTTGAGDAFWSGVLHAWQQCLPAAQCVQQGLSVAARKVQITGPLYANP